MFRFEPSAYSTEVGTHLVALEGRAGLEHKAIERLRRASIWLLAVSSTVAVAFAASVGLSIDFADASRSLLMVAAVLLASAMFATSAGRSNLSDCLGAQAIVGLGGLACGFISLAGLHLHFPKVDETLRAIDRATGLDGPAFAEWISNAPTVVQAVLQGAYWLAAPILILSLLIQALRHQRVQVWRAAFCFIGALLTVCLISILTPAKGVGVWLSQTTMARLPRGAARYFWDAFDAFYDQGHTILQVSSVDGVVCFPSFHIAMRLITVMLWNGTPVVLALSFAWFLLMAAATVPIGGHYFTDLVAGTIIWAGWFVLSGLLARPTASIRPVSTTAR